jgi:hypothetical protein
MRVSLNHATFPNMPHMPLGLGVKSGAVFKSPEMSSKSKYSSLRPSSSPNVSVSLTRTASLCRGSVTKARHVPLLTVKRNQRKRNRNALFSGNSPYCLRLRASSAMYLEKAAAMVRGNGVQEGPTDDSFLSSKAGLHQEFSNGAQWLPKTAREPE